MQSASYWKTKMSGGRRIRVRVASFPDDEPTSGSGRVKRSYNTKEKVRTQLVSVPLGAQRSAALQAFTAREAFFSPFVALSTLLFTYLARLSGEFGEPLRTGTTFANRPEQFMGTIGLFVSACNLQVAVEEDETILTLARKVQTEMIRTSMHQSYPVQNPIHRKVSETMLNYINAQFGNFAGRPMKTERIRCGYSNTPLAFSARDFDATGQLTLDFDFQCVEFTPERQRETILFFERMLACMLANPNQPLARLL
jgi:hypothetical protein